MTDSRSRGRLIKQARAARRHRREDFKDRDDAVGQNKDVTCDPGSLYRGRHETSVEEIDSRTDELLQKGKSTLDDIIDLNPYAIAIYDAEGHFVRANRAFLNAFKTTPPREYSIFEDPIAEKAGFSQEMQARVRTGEVVRIREMWYNPHDLSCGLPDVSICFSATVFSTRTSGEEIEHIVLMFDDVTEYRRAQRRQMLATRVLALLNQSGRKTDIIRSVLLAVKESTGLEAVGVRLREGEDFPYYETSGFSADFVQAENYLCARRSDGQPIRDLDGQPHLECMCGNVICGRTDAALPFFTEAGSFWTNSTTAFLTSYSEEPRPSPTRNRCNSAGYESVALIPLRGRGETIGLLQLNDTRKDMFTPEMISFFEEIGDSIGIDFKQRQAEEALSESEQRFRSLSEAAFEGIAFSENGVLVDANEAFARTYHCDIEELVGRPVIELVAPEDRKLVARNIRSGYEGVYEHKGIRKDGSLIDLEIRGRTVTYRGRRMRMAAIRDITDRKRAEEALARRAEFERIVSRISSDFVRLNANQMDEGISRALETIGVFTEADRAYVFQFNDDSKTRVDNTHEWCAVGIEAQIENLKDIPLAGELPWFTQCIRRHDVFHVPDVAALPPEAHLERTHFEAQDIKSLMVVPMTQNDGLFGFLGFDAVRVRRTWTDDDQALLRLVGEAVTHVLVRKQAENALRLSEQRHRNMIELAPDAIVVVNKLGFIESCNGAAKKVSGFQPEELCGRHFTKLGIFRPKDMLKYLRMFAQILTGKQQEPFEVNFVRKDGSEATVEVRVGLLENGNIQAIATDITERVRAQKRILEDRSQLRSLASQLSITEERERHRLATDLHDQIGQSLVFSKLRLDQLRKSVSSEEVAEALEEVCADLGQVIDDTRALTFDLSSPILYELGFEAAVAEWLKDEIRDKHGLETEFEDDRYSKPLGDEVRSTLFRNVRELLVNVLKHANAGKVKVSVRRVDENIRVGIEDDGVGFDPVEVTSTAAKRAEFGLFSVRQRLEQLGGLIEIDSEPGRGSKISMTAPLKLAGTDGTFQSGWHL